MKRQNNSYIDPLTGNLIINNKHMSLKDLEHTANYLSTNNNKKRIYSTNRSVVEPNFKTSQLNVNSSAYKRKRRKYEFLPDFLYNSKILGLNEEENLITTEQETSTNSYGGENLSSSSSAEYLNFINFMKMQNNSNLFNNTPLPLQQNINEINVLEYNLLNEIRLYLKYEYHELDDSKSLVIDRNTTPFVISLKRNFNNSNNDNMLIRRQLHRQQNIKYSENFIKSYIVAILDHMWLTGCDPYRTLNQNIYINVVSKNDYNSVVKSIFVYKLEQMKREISVLQKVVVQNNNLKTLIDLDNQHYKNYNNMYYVFLFDNNAIEFDEIKPLDSSSKLFIQNEQVSSIYSPTVLLKQNPTLNLNEEDYNIINEINNNAITSSNKIIHNLPLHSSNIENVPPINILKKYNNNSSSSVMNFISNNNNSVNRNYTISTEVNSLSGMPSMPESNNIQLPNMPFKYKNGGGGNNSSSDSSNGNNNMPPPQPIIKQNDEEYSQKNFENELLFKIIKSIDIENYELKNFIIMIDRTNFPIEIVLKRKDDYLKTVNFSKQFVESFIKNILKHMWLDGCADREKSITINVISTNFFKKNVNNNQKKSKFQLVYNIAQTQFELQLFNQNYTNFNVLKYNFIFDGSMDFARQYIM